MSHLFNTAMGIMAIKQSVRLKSVAKSSLEKPQTLLATVSGFNSDTGTYTATTPDGGELPVQLGNFGAPPSQVSIVATQGSTVQFADFRAPQ